VPLIKFECLGVKIDLLFACCELPHNNKVPDSKHLLNFGNFENEDKSNMASTMGYQQSLAILNTVSDRKVFSTTLRIIKRWAKTRGIYQTNFGYLNGISLTIMLAYVDKNRELVDLERYCESRGSSFDEKVQSLFESFF